MVIIIIQELKPWHIGKCGKYRKHDDNKYVLQLPLLFEPPQYAMRKKQLQQHIKRASYSVSTQREFDAKPADEKRFNCIDHLLELIAHYSVFLCSNRMYATEAAANSAK